MTGVSSLGITLGQIENIKDQNKLLNLLSTQMTTGKKSQTFSGLGTEVLVSKRARASYESIDTYSSNITHGDRRIKLMLNAVEEFKSQAENFANAIIGFSQKSAHSTGDEITYDDPLTPEIETTKVGITSAEMDTEFRALQDLARNLSPFMIDLLNSKEGGRYLLGGADTLTKPLNDTGTLDAAISTLITNWKDETLPPATNLRNAELISALQSRDVADDPNAVTDSIIGYSAALSAGNVGDVTIRVSESSEVEYTALANDAPFRDIMVALSYFKNENLAPIADVYAQPYTAGDPTLADGAPGSTTEEMKNNFYEVLNAMGAMVNKAIDDIDQVRFDLEAARARIAEVQQNQKEQQNALLESISGAEDVDINEVAVKITSLQTQLEASYRLTAMIQNLSLVSYL